MDKKIKVMKYQDHPELENKIVEVAIIKNEKRKPIVKKPIVPRKPKQPRMTIEQLAIIVVQQGTRLDQLATIVAEGFAAVNKRIDKIEETLQRHEEILMRHEQILNKHTEILERHEEIFKRNNLK
jgi:hypothetical protein